MCFPGVVCCCFALVPLCARACVCDRFSVWVIHEGGCYCMGGHSGEEHSMGHLDLASTLEMMMAFECVCVWEAGSPIGVLWVKSLV